MKNILNIAAAAGIMLGGTVAYAQTGNGSDVSGVSSGSVAGGSFTPLTVGNSGGTGGNAGGGSNAMGAVRSTMGAFNGRSAVTSPVTGTAINAQAVAAVGALMAGGSQTAVAGSLTSSGANQTLVNNLTAALAALGGVSPSSAPAAIVSAAQAYNALVASLPAGFLANPPASFLAINAALTSMVASVK